jgi:hypothetical protein
MAPIAPGQVAAGRRRMCTPAYACGVSESLCMNPLDVAEWGLQISIRRRLTAGSSTPDA